MKILVIGDTGFVAEYLLPAIKESIPACTLYGISRQSSGNYGTEAAHIAGDVTDGEFTAKIMQDIQPDVVFNLSSISSVFESWVDPIECHLVNYIGVLNICLALIKHAPAARLLHVSSMEVYGGSQDSSVCYDESSLVNPQSPYAVAKAASELVIRQYGISHGMAYTILRPSNHTGVGRKPRYVLSGFAKQLAEIKQGVREPALYVGNLNVYRDFMDVRDVVRAYVSVISADGLNQQIFNVSSGKSLSLAYLLNFMIEAAGLNVEIRTDPNRLRPVDTMYICGDNSRISKAIGWLPRITVEETLQELLKYWEKHL